MPKLSETISRLARVRAATMGGHTSPASDRLTDLEQFGSNPGNLRARAYVPARTGERPALVVVLHGCTQTAAGYDAGSGWSQLADTHGFVLLFPEQRRANNPNLCFNWFLPQDNRRDQGEALSIRQMIARMAEDHDVDPSRIFVTGLSAGGAMTSVMLATYPEVFASGAIIAGLPYGRASSVPEALALMRGRNGTIAPDLGALIRNASAHDGPWPTVSIWHGSGDATVDPVNAEAIGTQWRTLHGVAASPDMVETVDGYPRRVWKDGTGRTVIEDYSITGMGHGTPLDTLRDDPCGAAGPYMLEVSISSTRRIAAFWGMASAKPAATDTMSPPKENIATTALPARRATHAKRVHSAAPTRPHAAVGGVGKVIEDALRAAGLMR